MSSCCIGTLGGAVYAVWTAGVNTLGGALVFGTLGGALVSGGVGNLVLADGVRLPERKFRRGVVGQIIVPRPWGGRCFWVRVQEGSG